MFGIAFGCIWRIRAIANLTLSRKLVHQEGDDGKQIGVVIALSLREVAEAWLVANPSTEFADWSVEQLLHELRVSRTEREILDKELRDSEAINHATLDSIAAEIAVLDREGVIVAVNQAWRFFALENGTERGTPVQGTDIGDNYFSACQQSSYFPTDGAVNVRDGIQQVMDGRLPIFKLEYPCHSPQHERWFIMSVTPLGSEPRGVVVAHTDITERKKMEEALRENVADLIRFNNAAVGRELRMIELKKEVNRLCVQAGLPPRYALKFDNK